MQVFSNGFKEQIFEAIREFLDPILTAQSENENIYFFDTVTIRGARTVCDCCGSNYCVSELCYLLSCVRCADRATHTYAVLARL